MLASTGWRLPEDYGMTMIDLQELVKTSIVRFDKCILNSLGKGSLQTRNAAHFTEAILVVARVARSAASRAEAFRVVSGRALLAALQVELVSEGARRTDMTYGSVPKHARRALVAFPAFEQ